MWARALAPEAKGKTKNHVWTDSSTLSPKSTWPRDKKWGLKHIHPGPGFLAQTQDSHRTNKNEIQNVIILALRSQTGLIGAAYGEWFLLAM